jgi:tRNA threonylcarbamoyladenosine biosynthesis protein TsaB
VNVLGIDTSTAVSAACLLRSDGEAFEAQPAVEALSSPPAHSAELMPAVADCLERSGLGYRDLDAIAVGVGPGAFTGLRIGVATARALAHASGVELRPVSSLAALAAGIEDRARLPLIDARRGELFAALYEDGERRLQPFAATPEDVAERVRETGLDPLAAGDGSLRFSDVLEAAGVRIAATGSPAHVVRGLSICRAAADSPAMPPEAVLPDYLRLPDATPQAPT